VKQLVTSFFQQRFWRWLSKRMPPSQAVTLNFRNVFIFPSKSGAAFLLVAVLIWLLGTNYQSNLSLACAYFMLSVFIVAIFHTFANVAGLRVSLHSVQPVFAGDESRCDVRLERLSGGNSEHLLLQWPGGRAQSVTVAARSSELVAVYFKATERGLCKPGRLLLQSYFPLGLLRCWTHVDLAAEVLVYPAPLPAGELPGDALSGADDGEVEIEGSEDFVGFKDYLAGQSLKHVAWKQYARGQQMLLKSYCDYRTHQVWLQWQDLPGLSAEVRLSRLCDWVLLVSKTSEEYGLRLPGVEIQPSSGQQHRSSVLKALALFDSHTESRSAD
jgi:uncharacterized protein (DUF58 family)